MIKVIDDIQITPNFKMSEFANSKDGNKLKLDLDLVYKLQELRNIVGSITITSGYRTTDFNASVGGSKNSNHLKGTAADIKFNFTPWGVESLKLLLSGLGFNNIGIYMKKGGAFAWLHVDTSPRWNAKNGWTHFRNSAVKIYHV